MCMLVQRAMQGERSHVRKQGPKYELFCSLSVCVCVCVCVLPVKPQASARRNVLQDMRKNRAVSSS